MSNFFKEGYPEESFKLKSEYVAYLINYEILLTSSLLKTKNNSFDLLVKGELEDISDFIKYIPIQIEEIIKLLIKGSNFLYLEYQFDIEEQRFVHTIDRKEIFNTKPLDFFIKKYKYFSDIGFLLYGDKEDWSYFYGEDLDSEYPGGVVNFNGYDMFIVKKTFKESFIKVIESVAKNNVTIKKMKSVNCITIDNDEVYEITFT